jgi:hypothetical protein
MDFRFAYTVQVEACGYEDRETAFRRAKALLIGARYEDVENDAECEVVEVFP